MLMAAVANCLGASLLFALQKFIQDPGTLLATATPTAECNKHKRLRITGTRVQIAPGRTAAEMEHLDRVLSQFEDFCTVSMSVRQSIPIALEVTGSCGISLKV